VSDRGAEIRELWKRTQDALAAADGLLADAVARLLPPEAR